MIDFNKTGVVTKALVGLVAAAALSGAAQAQLSCSGFGAIRTCTDLSSSNVYNINRFGNTTSIDANNPRTGSSWSMQSQQIGNTTFNTGRAANGAAWSSTIQDFGSSRFINSTDSRGRSSSIYCNSYGCY